MIRKILFYITTFISSILFILLCSLTIVYLTIFNKSYICQVLKLNNYYKATYETIKDGTLDNIVQAGLENEDIDILFSEKDIEAEINNILDSIYTGKNIVLNSDELNKKIDNKISEIANKKNIAITSEVKSAVDILKKALLNVYTNNLVYSTKIIDTVSKYFQIIKGLVAASIITIILLLLVQSFILKVALKENLVSSFSIITLTTGIFYIILKFLIGNSLQDLLIINQNFSNVLTYLIYNIISRFAILGATCTLLSIEFLSFNYHRKY